MGKFLKKCRESHQMPLCVAIAEMQELKVKCSRSNLGKIENGDISCRADILGALSVIYGIDPKDILFLQ
jgi:hypothetical protein